MKLDAKENKQFIDAITTKNPDAEPVVKKVLKEAAQPLYGAFEYKGKVVEFEQDGELRDNENVPLNPAVSSSDLIENYFESEVLPHVNDAWINADKRDAKDCEVGIVGYGFRLTAISMSISRRARWKRLMPIWMRSALRL